MCFKKKETKTGDSSPAAEKHFRGIKAEDSSQGFKT
jgi:hypothetical protein